MMRTMRGRMKKAMTRVLTTRKTVLGLVLVQDGREGRRGKFSVVCASSTFIREA